MRGGFIFPENTRSDTREKYGLSRNGVDQDTNVLSQDLFCQNRCWKKRKFYKGTGNLITRSAHVT